MKITDADISFSTYPLRRPLSIASGVIRGVPQVFVKLRINSGRETVIGLGHNSYSPLWADRRNVPINQKDKEIRNTIAAIGLQIQGYQFTHPFDFYREFALKNSNSIPKLAYIMALSPFDLALWDAYAKFQKRHIFRLPEVKKRMSAKSKKFLEVTHLIDLGASLHSVGGVFKREGIASYKIKLCGDPFSDAKRINSFAAVKFIRYILADANEAYASEDELRQCISMLSEKSRKKLIFFEQPFPRDSKYLSLKIKGIALVADESYADHRDIEEIWRKGYRGVALKPHTKTFSGTLLALNIVKRKAMLSGVMDLTTAPPIGYIVGVLTAAHLPTIGPVELNGRQFYRNWKGLIDRGFRHSRDMFFCKKGRIRIYCDYSKYGWGIEEKQFDAYRN